MNARYIPILFLSLILWWFASGGSVLRAQDSVNDNPTGPTGDYNGEVTTGGSYDPYTMNAKRSVTDLVVPGSNGTYPLAFTRTYNSGISGVAGHDVKFFGDGGNWRHSYAWTITPAYDLGGTPNGYMVSYPSGGTVMFTKYRSNIPSGETYLRGPTGVQDRLELPNGSLANARLHTSDGGVVYFGANYHPIFISDPYGATTSLQYNGSGYLTDVIEPGGRFLHFEYLTVNSTTGGQSNTWVVLKTVTANGTSQSALSTVQRVTYTYGEFGGHLYDNGNGGTIYRGPYYVLTDVSYDSEPSVATQGGNVHAAYTYLQSGTAGPVIQTAVDPHYAGAMTSIRYAYSDIASGSIQEEQNINSPNQQRVSRLDHDANANASVETRGDAGVGAAAIQRTFRYDESNHTFGGSGSVLTNAKQAQLTSVTDFQGNNTYLYYYGPGDGNGEGNLFATVDAANRSTVYSREPFTGKVKSIQLPDGRTRKWLYLAKDLSTVTQPYYLYQSTDERNQTTTYQRFANTGLVSEIDYPDASSELFSYTGLAQYGAGTYYKIGYQKTKLGAQIYYTYGAGGSGRSDLLLSVERYYNDGTGTMRSEKTYFEYDAFDRLSKTTDPRGVITQFAYNARHQLTRTTHLPEGTHVDRKYDDLGNCTDVSDELGHTVHTDYDQYRRVVSVVAPVNDGVTVNRYRCFAYDRRDNSNNPIAGAVSHTASNWSLSWAPSSKAVQRVFSANNWLTDEYDGVYVSDNHDGTVTSHPSDGYVHTRTVYDSVGQVQSSVDAQNCATTFTYDNCGRKQSVADPLGHATSWTYYTAADSVSYQGWLKSVTSPGPDFSTNPTVTTNYTGYDVMGRVTSTVDPYSHTFLSGYDVGGDLTAQTDGAQPNANTQPQAHNTLYVYDGLGRKVSIANPRTGTKEKWTYDASGNVHTYQTYAGSVCTYQYDGRNRCTSYGWSDGMTSPVTYTYDVASRMLRVQNWHADLNYTYDDSGAVLTEKLQPGDRSDVLTTTYTRDLDGNIVKLLYPYGTAPAYTYDSQQRPTTTAVGSTTYSQYNYANDWLAGRWLANGLYTSYNYQANGRVWDVWHYHASDRAGTHKPNASVSRHLYGYAPDGQISWFDRESDGGQSGSALENGNGDCYFYAPDGSLSGAYRNYSYNGGTWPYQGDAHGDSRVASTALGSVNATADTHGTTYAYDAAGNRGTVNNYDQARQYVSGSTAVATADNGYTTCTYDANFNTATAGSWTYTYDSENHLVNVTGPGGVTLSCNYDGLGRLVKQIVNGAATRFYYAGSQRIEERDANNAAVYQYLFDAPGSDRLLCRESSAGNSARVWYQTDLMGNTTHLSNNAGLVVEQYLYDAYGQPSFYSATGSALPGGTAYNNRYLFKSSGAYEWLAGPGLYYCRARFYLPQHGRWLQTDPIGQAGGLNTYTYCHNDPVNGSDSSGLDNDSQTYVPTGSHIPAITWIDGSGGKSVISPASAFYFGGAYQYASGQTRAGNNSQPSRTDSVNYVTYGGEWSDADIKNFEEDFAKKWNDADGRKEIEKWYDDTKEYIITPDRHSGGLTEGANNFLIYKERGGFDQFLEVLGNIFGLSGNTPKWNFGGAKSAQKWQNQMQQRGWTPQQIDDAIGAGQQFRAPNNINPNNPAIRYVNPQTGRSVVIDTVTGEVIHVGGDGFKY